MENILEKLFESQAKVRMLRLFLRNPLANFTIDEVMRLTGLSIKQAEKELQKLLKLGLITKRTVKVAVSEVRKVGRTKKIRMREKVVPAFAANPSFEFFRELRDLILRQVPESRHKLVAKIKRIGKV